MLALLPLAFFTLTVLILAQRWRGADLREAFLGAAVVWGIAVWVLTELLSPGSLLRAGPLALGWTALTLGAVGVAIRSGALTPRVPFVVKLPPRRDLLLLVPSAAIMLTTAVVALAGWPNNWDSMVYHLSRVAHWHQNGSIAYYPTHIDRQLFMPPWAEYAALHLLVLGGDERFANLVQWFSILGSCVAASLVARALGAGARGQLTSALVCATLPIGILGASTTQNDNVIAFWMVCVAYGLLRLREQPTSLGLTLFTGASAGLALLTKSTAPIFLTPLVAVILVAQWRPCLTAIRQAALITLLALVIVAPHYARNLEVFGSPLGPVSWRNDGSANLTTSHANEVFNLTTIASNTVRSAAMHFGTPWPAVNNAVERAVRGWQQLLGISLNHPPITSAENRFDIRPPTTYELRATSPVHVTLIFITVLAVALSAGLRRDLPGLPRYAIAVCLAFVLFALMLKWHTQASRIQFPLFVLWCGAIGAVLGQVRGGSLLAAAVLVPLSVPYLVANEAHPLSGPNGIAAAPREEQYFRFRPSLRDDYLGATSFLAANGCQRVGLILEGNDWEYPLWALLPQVQAAGGRIEHVDVTNDSQRLADRNPQFTPCAVVVVRASTDGVIRVGDRVYYRAWAGDSPNRRAAVYLPNRAS